MADKLQDRLSSDDGLYEAPVPAAQDAADPYAMASGYVSGFMAPLDPPKEIEIAKTFAKPSQRSVEALRLNPEYSNDFDQMFGPGAAARHMLETKPPAGTAIEPYVKRPSVSWGLQDVLETYKDRPAVYQLMDGYLADDAKRMQVARDKAVASSLDAFRMTGGRGQKTDASWLDEQRSVAEASVGYWQRREREAISGNGLLSGLDAEAKAVAEARLEAVKAAQADLDDKTVRQAEAQLQVMLSVQAAMQKNRLLHAEQQLAAFDADPTIGEQTGQTRDQLAANVQYEMKRLTALNDAYEYARQTSAVPNATGRGEVARSLVRALMAETPEMFAGALSRLAKDVGNTGLHDLAQDMRSSLKSLRQDIAAPKQGEFLALDPSSPTFGNDLWLYSMHTLGQGLGTSATTIVAAMTLGKPGAVGAGLSMGIGQMENALEDAFAKEGLKFSEHDRPGLVYAFGAAIGALDSFSTLFNLGALSNEVKHQAVRHMASALARGAAKGATVEAITEAMQESLQMMGETYALDKKMDWKEYQKRVLEAFAGAVTPGAVLGARTGYQEQNQARARKIIEDIQRELQKADDLAPAEPKPAAEEAPKGGRPQDPVQAEARDPATVPRPQPVVLKADDVKAAEGEGVVSRDDVEFMSDVGRLTGLADQTTPEHEVVPRMVAERQAGATFGEEIDGKLDALIQRAEPLAQPIEAQESPKNDILVVTADLVQVGRRIGDLETRIQQAEATIADLERQVAGAGAGVDRSPIQSQIKTATEQRDGLLAERETLEGQREKLQEERRGLPPASLAEGFNRAGLQAYLEQGGSLDLTQLSQLAEALGVERAAVVPALEQEVLAGNLRKDGRGRYRRVPVESEDLALGGEKAQIEDLILAQVAAGKSVSIPAPIRKSLLAGLRSVAHLAPPNTPMAVVSKIVPIPEERRKGISDVAIELETIDGGSRRVALSSATLFEARAFFDRRIGTIVSSRLFFNPGEAALKALGGEVRHEGVHVLWGQLERAIKDRLVVHANTLGVLDMEVGTVSSVIEGKRSSDTRTLRDAYTKMYRAEPDFQDRIDQEAVAHMVELAHHGFFGPMELEPVQDILSSWEGAALAGGEGVMLAISDRAVGQSMRRDLDSLGSVIEDGQPMFALRSNERAAAVLGRAARMRQFDPGFSIRGMFDPQMRPPGYIDQEPFNLADVTVASRSTQEVPLKDIFTVQTSVSVAATQQKIRSPASDAGDVPSLFLYKGTYYVNDGNHRIVAARAKGLDTIKAEVIELRDKAPVEASGSAAPGQADVQAEPGSVRQDLQDPLTPAEQASFLLALAGRDLPDGQRRVAWSGLGQPPKPLSQLIADLNKALGLTTRMGRLNPGLKASAAAAGGKLRGQYNTATDVTRLAIPNDIDTLAHEGGHALEERFGMPLRLLMEQSAAELEPLATPGQDQLSEGFAEFFRRYMVNPSLAETKAPKFFKAFEEFVDHADPNLLAALQGVSDGYQAWIDAPSGGTVASSIVSGKKDGVVREMTKHVRRNGFTNAATNFFHAAYTTLIDRMHPVNQAVKQLIDIANVNLVVPLSDRGLIALPAARDPYKLLRLARNAYQTGHMDLMRGVRAYKGTKHEGPSLHDAIGTAMGGFGTEHWTDENIQRFGAYLTSRRMVQEWDRFKVGDIDRPPDKFSRADHEQAIADFEKASPKFAEAAQMVYAFQRNLLAKAKNAGFVSEETYDDLTRRRDYVPVQRNMDDGGEAVESGAGATTRGANKSKLIKRFGGSTRDVINPLESIARATYEWNMVIARNEAIKALDRLARSVGPGGGRIAERIPANQVTGAQVNAIEIVKRAGKQAGVSPEDMLFLTTALEEHLGEDADTVLMTPGVITEGGEPIVYLWEDGKRVALRLGDGPFGKWMYESITELGAETMPAALEILAKPSQWLRAGVTLDPAFVAANWVRDTGSAWMLSRDHGALLPNAAGGFAASGTALMDAFGRAEEMLDQFRSFGGITGGVGQEGLNATRLKRDIDGLRKKGIDLKQALPHNKQFWELMGVTETGTRLSVFRRARDRALADGLDEYEALVEAAYTANDLLDFGRYGSRMLVMRRLVTFLNAQLQGMDKAGRVLMGFSETARTIQDVASPYLRQSDGHVLTVAEREKVPLAAMAWAKAVIGFGAIGALMALAYRDDDEFQEIPEHIRTTHWVFRDPSGVWRRIPRPFELGAASLVVERAFEAYYQRDGKAMERMRDGLFQLVKPNHVVPGVQVAYELWANKSGFTGAPIVPANLQKLPGELQFTAYTSEFSKWLAKGTGVSAAKIDHAIAGVTGSLGRSILDKSNTLMPRAGQALENAGLPTFGISSRPRPEMRQSEMIFVRRFTVDPARSSQSKKDFWEQMSETSGNYAQKAAGYKEFYDRGQFGEASELLRRMTENERIYALLEGHGSTSEKRGHPFNRAKQVLSVTNGVRRDLDTGKLKDDNGNEYGPSDRRVIQEIIEQIQMREARNAQVVAGEKGYEGKKIMPVEPVLRELETKVPSIAEEIEYRLRQARVRAFDDVVADWPTLKADVLDPSYAPDHPPRRKVGRRAP